MKALSFTLVLLGLTTGVAYAQGPGSGGPRPQQPTAVPIDGGASLLVAGAVAYGIKHLRRRRA